VNRLFYNKIDLFEQYTFGAKYSSKPQEVFARRDTKLTKFHGIYQQDDRDLREERAKQGLEKAFSFMIRVRVPGGVSTPEQYLAVDQLADKYANGTIKLTTRQAYQLHGVLKKNLKTTIQGKIRYVPRWRNLGLTDDYCCFERRPMKTTLTVEIRCFLTGIDAVAIGRPYDLPIN
jgi:hypothetical protein